MKTLLIFRHAKSSWKDDTLPDHDRPLNRRGKEAAPAVGELIRREGLSPDLILSSTAIRAKTTAELAADAGEFDCEIRLSRDLYAAGPEALLKAIAALEDRYDRVVMVGHNPGLEELVQLLTRKLQPMPTAALAWIELDVDHWKDVGPRTNGKLMQFWKPKGGE